MTVGVDVRRAKTLVFLISAPMVSPAGGLFYIDNVTITPPDAFHSRWPAFIVYVVVASGSRTPDLPVTEPTLTVPTGTPRPRYASPRNPSDSLPVLPCSRHR